MEEDVYSKGIFFAEQFLEFYLNEKVDIERNDDKVILWSKEYNGIFISVRNWKEHRKFPHLFLSGSNREKDYGFLQVTLNFDKGRLRFNSPRNDLSRDVYNKLFNGAGKLPPDRKEACEKLKEYLDAVIEAQKNQKNNENISGKNGDTLDTVLDSHMNVILTGAPGTGKTFSARKYITSKLNNDETALKKRFKFVQFHAGYDYTDFVQGYKPVLNNDGVMTFEKKDGVFKAFCDAAATDPDNDYYFLIDEINRADLSRVFGELFYGIEEGYRGKPFTTQYGDEMTVPENLHLIGTMNDVDRGVETIDFALRRRFIWHEVTAENSENIACEELRDRMQRLNAEIAKPEYKLGTEYQIGGAYFKENVKPEILWKSRIEPLLKEYLRGRKNKDDVMKSLKKAYDGTVNED